MVNGKPYMAYMDPMGYAIHYSSSIQLLNNMTVYRIIYTVYQNTLEDNPTEI